MQQAAAPLPPQLEQILNGLNAAQRAAAEHRTGPAMVIAGAGAGKTRVLTVRMAVLLATQAATPWELLALTFTNKAAREMKDRVAALIGPAARNLMLGTFHSVFARVLRVEAERLGYTSSFTIYDTDDSRSLVKTLLRELGLDDKKYKPRSILGRISLAKNLLVGPAQYAREYVDDEFTKVTSQVYRLYRQRCQRANAMDFDDILVNMAELLTAHDDLLQKYQHKWKYVLVDEYQDTNHAQYVITKKLAAVHENILVVGDDAQSIYSFRGANIQNILNFQKDYPDLQVYKLEQNYRSTSTIVDAANKLIEHNQDRLPKTVFTQNGAGEKIKLFKNANEQEEAHKVVDSLREQKLIHGLPASAFGILYRTNAQSRALEDNLRRANIPYRVYGGTSFYARKEIKDVLAYLKLAVNPTDEEALKRIINYPARGIGAKSIEAILTAATDHDISLWEVVKNAPAFVGGRGTAAISAFAGLVESFQALALRAPAGEVVHHVAKESKILRTLHDENSVESLSRWENVQELINAAHQFSESVGPESASLANFLAEVSLLTDQDTGDPNADHVSLMTVHAAKGLEFDSVFIVGLEDGLFPSYMSLNDRQDLEEERRLFYVAMTRAKQRLALSYADSRLRFGQRETSEPSRFLEEVPEEFYQVYKRPQPTYELPQRPSKAPARPAPRRPSKLVPVSAAGAAVKSPALSAADIARLAVGVAVEHAKFGQGTITRLEKDRMVVDFPQKPNTTLLLKFARVKVLG